MNDSSKESTGKRHTLSDWLALHELDHVDCRKILEAIEWKYDSEPAGDISVNHELEGVSLEVAWLRTVEAMHEFLPEHRGIIDATYEHSVKIVVDQRGKPRKAATLDNGRGKYPTIVLSFEREPSDFLVVAHEFAHAVQIRASGGAFVSPILREVCAFLGERALLSYTRCKNTKQHLALLTAWHISNRRYFGEQRERLLAALAQPDALYRYSWNYPIARYLADQILDRSSSDWIWSLFKGELSVPDILQELPNIERLDGKNASLPRD